jgi:hypothetical protein
MAGRGPQRCPLCDFGAIAFKNSGSFFVISACASVSAFASASSSARIAAQAHDGVLLEPDLNRGREP